MGMREGNLRMGEYGDGGGEDGEGEYGEGGGGDEEGDDHRDGGGEAVGGGYASECSWRNGSNRLALGLLERLCRFGSVAAGSRRVFDN